MKKKINYTATPPAPLHHPQKTNRTKYHNFRPFSSFLPKTQKLLIFGINILQQKLKILNFLQNTSFNHIFWSTRLAARAIWKEAKICLFKKKTRFLNFF